MLFCAFVSTAFAAATDLPEITTEGNIKWYAIKNTRSNKYAAYLSSNAKLEQVSDLSLAALFYFEGTVEETDQLHTATKLATVKIGNFVVGSNKLAGFDSWSADGATWYMWANNDANGIVVVDKTGDKNDDGSQKNLWGAWDDAGSTGSSSTKVGDYYAVSEGTNWVLEAKTFEDVKTIAKADLAKLAKLSALSTETNYNTAVSSVDAAATVEAVQLAVVTYLNTFNNKNVRFSNNGNSGREGLNLSVNAGGGGLMGNLEAKDNSVWTMLSNGDGTFKLYNFSRNVYAKADRSCNADASQAGSFALKVTNDNKTALVAGNEMIHQATYWFPNYNVISHWDYSDAASIWTVEACDPTAITRADYDAALDAKATLPWGIQQAYGLVKSGDNIKVVVNHPSGSDCQPSSNLLDGLTSSFVHSAYEGDDASIEHHYIQANLGEGGVDQFYVYMTPRNANNRPKEIVVSGSNTEDGEYTTIATITTTLASSDVYMSEKLGTASTKYQYIRLTVNSTNTNSKFFTLSECYFLPATGDSERLISAYHNFATASVLSNEITTAATTLINGEVTLALANIKKEVAPLLTANATNHAETPALGQYSTAAYNALQDAYNATDATQESLETALANFKKAKNVPVYFITSKHNGYAAGSAIYYDGAWKWKLANKYDKQMWMTIPDYNQANVPVVDAYDANGTSYAICDYLTGTKMRGKDVQIVKVADWEGAYNLQYNADANSTDAAQHAKDTKALVGWKPGTKNDAQASVWGVEYLGSSYELDQLTDEKIAALAALQTAYNAVADFKNAEIGTGLGEYVGSKDAIEAAVTAAEVIEAKTLAEQAVLDVATIVAATTALNDCADDLTINLPVAGKYYRFQGACEASLPNYYITGHTNWDGGRIALTDAADASTIYYFDGTNLIAYQSGLVIGLNDSHWTFASVDDNSKPASTITFAGSPRKAGTYTIKSANRYFHYTVYNNTVQVNRCQDDVCKEHDWYITEVTELPVTITSAGYASFYAPVEVTLPTGVTAHTVTENGGWATLSDAISVVPAENGVILAGEEGDYNLVVSNTEAADLEGALAGTVAKTLVTKENGAYYVLGIVEGEVGLYNPVKGNENTKFYNAGHKAYWHIPATSQTAGFRFGGNTTAIESVLNGVDANAPIYDLSGRRVNNAVKGGIYIQNGKKFIVK